MHINVYVLGKLLIDLLVETKLPRLYDTQFILTNFHKPIVSHD